jgi:hypothetical protein
MLSWAQRTAQWTVKTLPFTIGLFSDAARGTTDAAAHQAGDEAVTTPEDRHPGRPADHGSRHRASHERVAVPSTRGRHAAPSRSRRARTPDAG